MKVDVRKIIVPGSAVNIDRGFMVLMPGIFPHSSEYWDGTTADARGFTLLRGKFFPTEEAAWAAWMAALLQADPMEHHEKL